MSNITFTAERKNQIEMLISFANMKSGYRYKFSNEKNQVAMNNAIEAADGDITAVKAFLKEAATKKPFDLVASCTDFVLEQTKKPPPAPAPVAPAAQPDNLNASINFLGQVVVDLLAKTKLDEIRNVVSDSIKNELRDYIMQEYGPIQRKVEFQLPERKVQLEGVVHEKFEKVLKYVQADIPVFLTGPAGSGKNVLCQQVAKTLGLDFYFSNAVTQEHKITGYSDAMGVFHESQFYKAFKNGGLFMLDEMDASIPEVLIILNAAIANRYFDFPAPIGYVEAHPDFRVIAAGNTFGNGADYDYVGRSQLDAASLNRFAMVRIEYDSRIEESCANGDMELLKFCRKFRKATQKAGIRTVVSYRNITMMAKLSQAIDTDELLDNCLIKSLDLDDMNAIRDSVMGCGKYSDAFNKVLTSRANA